MATREISLLFNPAARRKELFAKIKRSISSCPTALGSANASISLHAVMIESYIDEVFSEAQ
jgi:hypothetical protein